MGEFAAPLQERGERILHGLGLSSSQARVYFSLVRLGGTSTVKALSLFSNVARQDVYGTLAELQELGLVETLVGNPAGFRAVPLPEVVAILQERRTQTTSSLMIEATNLLEKVAKKVSKLDLQEGYPQFVLIPKKEVLFHRIERATKTAQASVFIFTPWIELTQWVSRDFAHFKEALARGVEIRWITEKSAPSNLQSEALGVLAKAPKFRVGYIANPFAERFGIFDGKELFIATVTKPNAGESPALWTNNSGLIRILEDYFKMKWKTKIGKFEP